MYHSASSRDKSKIPERHLASRLDVEVGLAPAQIQVTLELLADHLSHYFSDLRPPGEVIHTAVSIDEPAGKPIRSCKVIPVRLTYFAAVDLIVAVMACFDIVTTDNVIVAGMAENDIVALTPEDDISTAITLNIVITTIIADLGGDRSEYKRMLYHVQRQK